MNDKRKVQAPPAVFSADPEEQIEERLRQHPDSPDAKVDAGSDESMDASDPISVARPKADEPAPSSGYPQDDQEDSSQNAEKDR